MIQNFIFFACLCQISAGSPNQCSQSRSALPPPNSNTDTTILTRLLINEVYYSSSDTAISMPEYVELKGPANMPLDEYTLVTFTADGYAANSVKLTNQQTSFSTGLITIVTAGLGDLTVSFSPLIPRGKGAIALYVNVGEISVGGNDMVGYRNNLVDALVYTDDSAVSLDSLSQRLTPDSDAFYPANLE